MTTGGLISGLRRPISELSKAMAVETLRGVPFTEDAYRENTLSIMCIYLYMYVYKVPK